VVGGIAPIIPVTLHGSKGFSLFEAYVDSVAVHDYIGVSDEEYLGTIQKFLPEAKKLLK
jgi:hypothetical protein